jgi:hypothetical protein
VTGITPPTGTGGGTVKPQDYIDPTTGHCVESWFGGVYGTGCKTGKDLQEKERQLEEDLKNATGDAERLRIKTELEKTRVAYLAWRACGGGSTECVDYVNRLGNSDYYKSLDPAKRLHLWQTLQGGLSSGDVGKPDLQGMVRLAENCAIVNRTMNCKSAGGTKDAILFVIPAVELVLAAGVLVYAAAVTWVNSGRNTYQVTGDIRDSLPWLNRSSNETYSKGGRPVLDGDPYSKPEVDKRVKENLDEHYPDSDSIIRGPVNRDPGKPGSYKPAPRDYVQNGLPGMPGTEYVPGSGRRTWVDQDGNIYEWDSENGRVEKYSPRGRHVGEFDPATGKQTKPGDPRRKPQDR